MTSTQEKLVDYLREAHAMETNILRMLDSMISTTSDTEIRGHLEHHKEETERHRQRVEECLEGLGESPSRGMDIGGVLGAMGKAALDQARSDKPMRNARDGYATEHAEIAFYEHLERFAEQAGQSRIADAARANKADEEAMARKIEANWDRFVHLTMEEEDVSAS